MSLPHLTHPGPITHPRLEALPARAHPLTLRLRAGRPIFAAATEALAAAGFTAGYLRLDGAVLAPAVHVIPAPAPGDGRVAWFSAPRHLARARIGAGGLHVGTEDGTPFCHCHGVWSGGDAPPVMGHLLGDESLLAKDAVVTGWGLSGAAFRREHDPETRFSIFAPVPVPAPSIAGGQPALLCRLRPNEDLAWAIGSLGLPQARIEGIGSLIGARFLIEQPVPGDAAEFLIEAGEIAADGLRLQVAATGMDGRLRRGLLAPARNPVCVTAELLLLPGG